MQMRAAAEDFRMARVLGIRANTVIAAAFALSRAARRQSRRSCSSAQTGDGDARRWASTSSCSRSSRPILGGMGSLRGAVLGGFSLGALTVALQASLPLELRAYRDAFVFAAVLAVLVVRPQGLLPARATLAREVPRRPRLRPPQPAGRARLARSRRRTRPARRGGGAHGDRLAAGRFGCCSSASWRCSCGRSGRTRSIASCSGW